MTWQEIKHTEVVARKRHTCWVCGGWIGVGEPYINQRCASDGRAYTLHHHAICWHTWNPDDGDGDWEGGAESLRAELALLVPLLAPGTGES